MSSGVELRQFATDYQRRMINLAGRYSGFYAELGRMWKSGRITDTQYVRLCVELERAGCGVASKDAARFVHDFRRMAGVDPGDVVVDSFDPSTAVVRGSSTLNTADMDEITKIIDAKGVSVGTAVLNAARDMVSGSAVAAHRTWRRVTDGDPCAFCAMLATRDDYSSRDAALIVGSNRRSRKKNGRPLGSKYHDYCGCTAVEVVGPWESIGADERYLQVYSDAVEYVTQNGDRHTVSNVVAAMRTVGDMR